MRHNHTECVNNTSENKFLVVHNSIKYLPVCTQTTLQLYSLQTPPCIVNCIRIHSPLQNKLSFTPRAIQYARPSISPPSSFRFSLYTIAHDSFSPPISRDFIFSSSLFDIPNHIAVDILLTRSSIASVNRSHSYRHAHTSTPLFICGADVDLSLHSVRCSRACGMDRNLSRNLFCIKRP